jgi:predicted nucleic acid-binding protein
MKRYWDTSALVDALHDSRIESLALEPDQWIRPHTLAEAFSTLTGGRLGFKYLPSDAAAMLRDLTARFNFVELDAPETLAVLAAAEKRGVRGGRVHDWLHACAAKKAGVTILLTDNLTDFTGLEDGFQIGPP